VIDWRLHLPARALLSLAKVVADAAGWADPLNGLLGYVQALGAPE
ncbi:putative phage protein (partial), partial [Bordetella avium 197N]